MGRIEDAALKPGEPRYAAEMEGIPQGKRPPGESGVGQLVERKVEVDEIATLSADFQIVGGDTESPEGGGRQGYSQDRQTVSLPS